MKTPTIYVLLRRCNNSCKNFFQVFLSVIFLLFFNHAFAQIISRDVCVSSGGYYTGDHISFSWSIGECIVETASDASISLTQGFQQPDMIITAITDPLPGNTLISVYPNPTTDQIYIQILSPEDRNFQAELFNLQGHKLQSKSFNGSVTQFYIKHLPAGTYLIKISTSNEHTLFKIQKTK